MNCPKCGLARALTDRVCRRCKYFFDEDRFIEIPSPSSDAMAAPLDSARLGLWAGVRRRMQSLRERPWARAVATFAAALVPGLPQALSGRRRRGAAFLGLVSGLLGGAILLFPSDVGSVLYGAAISAHAYGIFEESPWSRHLDWKRRLFAMVCVLAALMIFYGPLFEALRQWRAGPPQRQLLHGGEDAIRGLLRLGFFFVGVVAFSWIVALVQATRARRRQAR